MNLIKSTLQNQYTDISNWVTKTPINTMIDNVTYDQYESTNPFRRDVDTSDINNRALRKGIDVSTAVGAELYSVFANPYYLTHKIVSVPSYCHAAIDAYKQYLKGNNTVNQSTIDIQK